MMQDRVIGKEAPDFLSGMFSDDDEIRQWVQSTDLAVLGRQSKDEKIRMILTLMSGWISDDDVSAMARICRSVNNRSEAQAIRDAITPHLIDMTSIGQRTQMRVTLSQMP